MRDKNKRNVFNKLPLFLAVSACLYGPVAFAQDADESEQAETAGEAQQATELDRITVTGSLLRRVEFDSVSPVQVVTADTSVAVGQVDTAEFLQKSSVAAGSTQISHQFGGFVVEGGTGVQTVSLRGLGENRTLVLLNGKRPGPAGTRGQVGAFDLNVIPSSLLQRAEILKDGSSSIYGSDAVAGVVNLITRKSIDRPEITVSTRTPFAGGGEIFSVSGATGWNFDNGSVVLAGEYFVHKPLTIGDRRFFRCPQDLAWDQNGNRIDRQDRSIIGDTALGGCSAGNLYANTIIDAAFGTRYIPSPDGVTIGPFPGYRPRANPTYANGGQAYYEDVLNYDFINSAHVINRQERKNVYASADFSFGNINWNAEFLYNRRETDVRGFRQFFPLLGGSTALIPGYEYANDPDFVTPTDSGLAQVVMPFSMNQAVQVDYYYLSTGLDGLFTSTDTWAWQANASYSRSSGDYGIETVVGSRSGDVSWDDDAPVLNYFDPCFLSGECMDQLRDTVAEWDWGNTVYDQFVFNAVVTGEVFNMPAGPVGAALGVEYRKFSIDDQPGPLELADDRWGLTSAQPTKGDDTVKEIFGEIEVPLLKGVPGFESLVANVSARVFDYDSVDDRDSVWKAGLSWQITPAFRVRATKGTSYRAPGLYELYLGNLSSFTPQLGLDPCIDWGNSNNENLRANCGAAGIPADFSGGPSSAQVFRGGGAGFLNPETSSAFTSGLVWTPAFAPLSVALDYFEIEVKDQIATLGANSILGSCYAADVYPNAFCDMFERNSPNDAVAPNSISEVYATYVNINKQKVRGYDLLMRYDNDFTFGNLEIEGNFTYTLEDVTQLFADPRQGGSSISDFVGHFGRPELVGNLRTALKRGDWTYTWFMDYVSSTEHLTNDPTFTYFGWENAVRDIVAESRLYHTVSLRYEQPKWTVLVGVRNVFGDLPPSVSGGLTNTSLYGNTPAFATQYDWYGRTLFARWNYKF